MLVESIVADLGRRRQRFLMVTRDAHEVRRRCGFAALEGTDRWLKIDQRPATAAIRGVI